MAPETEDSRCPCETSTCHFTVSRRPDVGRHTEELRETARPDVNRIHFVPGTVGPEIIGGDGCWLLTADAPFQSTWFNIPNTGFGGTSVLIVVGVLLDTIAQVEQHRTLRKYDGFMKTGRVKFRGRQQRYM